MVSSFMILETRVKVFAGQSCLQKPLASAVEDRARFLKDDYKDVAVQGFFPPNFISRYECPATVEWERPPVIVISFDFTAFSLCKRDPRFIELFKDLITYEGVRIVFNSRSPMDSILSNLRSHGVNVDEYGALFNQSNFLQGIQRNGEKRTALKKWLKEKGLTPRVVVHIDDDPLDELNFSVEDILHEDDKTKVMLVRVLYSRREAGKVVEYVNENGDIISDPMPRLEEGSNSIDAHTGLPDKFWPEEAADKLGLIVYGLMLTEDTSKYLGADDASSHPRLENSL